MITFVAIALLPFYAYFIVRVAASAYFREKMNYQRTLIKRASTGSL